LLRLHRRGRGRQQRRAAMQRVRAVLGVVQIDVLWGLIGMDG
jgi:hypothetical protein